MRAEAVVVNVEIGATGIAEIEMSVPGRTDRGFLDRMEYLRRGLDKKRYQSQQE